MSQSAQAEIITCIPSNCQHLPNGKAIYSHHGLRSNHWANYKFTGRRFGEQHWKEGLLWKIRESEIKGGVGGLFTYVLPQSLCFFLPSLFLLSAIILTILHLQAFPLMSSSFSLFYSETIELTHTHTHLLNKWSKRRLSDYFHTHH